MLFPPSELLSYSTVTDAYSRINPMQNGGGGFWLSPCKIVKSFAGGRSSDPIILVLSVYRYGTKTIWEMRVFTITLLPFFFKVESLFLIPRSDFPHSFTLESNKLGIKFCHHLLVGYAWEVQLANSLNLIGKVGSEYFKMIIKNEMRWYMQRRV